MLHASTQISCFYFTGSVAMVVSGVSGKFLKCFQYLVNVFWYIKRNHVLKL